jgi:acyl carrier protein
MDEKKFLNCIREAFELDKYAEVSLNDYFKSYDEWDSLSQLSLIAMLDEEYGLELESASLEKLNTIGELLEWVKKKS